MDSLVTMSWSPLRILLTISLSALLLLAPGCASLAPDVGVQLVDIRMGESRTLETSALVTVRLTNRSSRALSAKGATAQVYLNGELIGEAASPEPITLEPFSTREIPLEVSVSHLALAMRIQPLLDSGVALYRIEAKLHQGRFMPPVHVSSTGQIDLRQLGARPQR